MTTIGSVPSFSMGEGQSVARRSASRTGFNDHYDQASVRVAKTQPDGLAELMEQLEALKGRQLDMSIRDYLLASFSLQDQIAAERLAAGEEVETLGIRYEGQVFRIAGQRLDVELPQVDATKLFELRRYSEY
jgi:hypothetical protein